MATPKRSGIKVAEPPPRRTHNYDWDQIADELRAEPGQWHLIFEGGKHSLVTAIRIDGIRALRKDKGFEVRTTNNIRPKQGSPDKRTCDLYLRYNPAADTERRK
jgi:hypothetical protein